MRSARSANLGKLCQSISRSAGQRTGINLPTAAEFIFYQQSDSFFGTLARFASEFECEKCGPPRRRRRDVEWIRRGLGMGKNQSPGILAVHFSPHLIGRKLSQTTAHRQPNQSVAKQIAAAPRRITHLCSHFRRPAAKCAKKSSAALAICPMCGCYGADAGFHLVRIATALFLLSIYLHWMFAPHQRLFLNSPRVAKVFRVLIVDKHLLINFKFAISLHSSIVLNQAYSNCFSVLLLCQMSYRIDH